MTANRPSWRYTTIDVDIRWQRELLARLLPGTAFCLLVAMAGHFVTDHYGGPLILLTLLLGMAFHPLSLDQRYAPGIGFCSTQVLRIGVALLGARITFDQLQYIGMKPLLLVVIAVPATLLVSLAIGRFLKLSVLHSILAGAAVAICGASAALAVAAVLPWDKKDSERQLICVVVGVTGLSTLAMLLYPLLASVVHFDAVSTALFLGGTIHDVAQVAGAGYLVSHDVGDLATFTKMLRVAALVPLVMVLTLIYRPASGRAARVPGFLLVFAGLVLLSGAHLLPQQLVDICSNASRLCLLLTIAGLGARTNLTAMLQLGWKPLTQLLVNTTALALLVLVLLKTGIV